MAPKEPGHDLVVRGIYFFAVRSSQMSKINMVMTYLDICSIASIVPKFNPNLTRWHFVVPGKEFLINIHTLDVGGCYHLM